MNGTGTRIQIEDGLCRVGMIGLLDLIFERSEKADRAPRISIIAGDGNEPERVVILTNLSAENGARMIEGAADKLSVKLTGSRKERGGNVADL